MFAAELLEQIPDGDDDPFRVAPIGVAAKRDVECGLPRVHTFIETLARFILDEFEVALHLANRLLVAYRPVPGDDHVDIHRKNAVARADPVRHRPGPGDWRAFVEEKVAGEYNPV